MRCIVCGEIDYDIEEDTGKVYCTFCGQYTGEVVELYGEDYWEE